MRIRSLRARKLELERLVEARTHELLREKEGAEAARAQAERHRAIAEHADHVKTEVLAIAAHDLKTPLQSVLGFAELAVEQCPPGSPAAEYTGIISDGAARMLQIVESLLDMTALDEGRLVPSRQPVDLGQRRGAGHRVEPRLVRPQAAAGQPARGAVPCVQGDDSAWLR